MLDFKNVTKKYPDGNISLQNINFNINEGEFAFIVGSSGAGKSTLVRLILNIEKPSEGEIIFNNTNVSKLKGNKLAYMRRQIGVVFQDFKLLQQKNVFENVSFVLEVARESKVNINKKVNKVLDLVGLIDKAKKFPSELSGGEQQRIAIARALVNDPLLLIADEPTGHLDSTNSWDIFQLINKINNWGTAILVVTHDTEIVDAIRKRVIQLEKGSIVRDSIGGYTEYIPEPKAKEEYIHNQDKFPNTGETTEEYLERKAKEKAAFEQTQKDTHPQESLDNHEGYVDNEVNHKKFEILKNRLSKYKNNKDVDDDE